METVGDHEGPANADVLKRHHAKIYGDKATPSKALKQMKADKVVEGEVPSASQLKYQRRQSTRHLKLKAFQMSAWASCVNSLKPHRLEFAYCQTT